MQHIFSHSTIFSHLCFCPFANVLPSVPGEIDKDLLCPRGVRMNPSYDEVCQEFKHNA